MSENDKYYRTALLAIAKIAGNLSDEQIEAVGGINDGRARAMQVVAARKIACNALGIPCPPPVGMDLPWPSNTGTKCLHE